MESFVAMVCVVLIPLLCFSFVENSSIESFLKHRKVYNFSVTILNGSNWVEYKYYFDNTESTQNNTNDELKIRIYHNPKLYFDVVYDLHSYEIIKTLAQPFNYSIQFLNDTKINCTEIENSLIVGEMDLFIGHFCCNFENPKIILLQEALTSKYVYVSKRKKIHSTRDIFILTFAGWLWFCFIIVLILLAVCLHTSTKLSYYKLKLKHRPWTWVEITLWAIAATCQQGLSYEPVGCVSCTIFILGYLLAYLLYTGFTAVITSVLIENDFNTPSKIDDLGKSSMVCLHYLCLNKPSRNILTVDNLSGFFNKLEESNTVGVTPKILIDHYFANHFNYTQVKTYSVVETKHKFSSGFFTTVNNPWRKHLNSRFVRLQESGILKNILERSKLQVPVEHSVISYSRAGKEHIGSALLLFLSGIAASLLFLLLEFTYKHYKK